MWRRIRHALDTDPSVELVETVTVSTEALTAATVGPLPLTDAALIEQLKNEVAARGGTIQRLQDQLRERPEPAADCPGCAGLRKTLADLEKSRAEDRKTIARLQLASSAGRAQTLGAPLRPMPDGGA